MTKSIARDLIYRTRALDAAIIELLLGDSGRRGC